MSFPTAHAVSVREPVRALITTWLRTNAFYIQSRRLQKVAILAFLQSTLSVHVSQSICLKHLPFCLMSATE